MLRPSFSLLCFDYSAVITACCSISFVFRFCIAFQLFTLFRDDRFRAATKPSFASLFSIRLISPSICRHLRDRRQLIFFVDEASHRDQQLRLSSMILVTGNRTFVIGRQHGDAFQMRQRLQEATVFIYATFCIRAATTQQQLQRVRP